MTATATATATATESGARARARAEAGLAVALAEASGQRLLHAHALVALALAHEAYGDAGSAHTARARAEALYGTIGGRTGSRVPPRPLPGHRHRELPQDAESRLTLYLTEHFDG